MSYGAANIDIEERAPLQPSAAPSSFWGRNGRNIALALSGTAAVLTIAVVALASSQAATASAVGTTSAIKANAYMPATTSLTWNVNMVRGNLPENEGKCMVENCRLQVNEVYFYDADGNLVEPSSVAVSPTMIYAKDKYKPDMMIDGDVATGFVNDNFDPVAGAPMTFKFSTATEITSFKFTVADEWSLRDPISWTVSNDEGTILATANEEDVVTKGTTEKYDLAFPGPSAEGLWGSPEVVFFEDSGNYYYKYTDTACSDRNEIAAYNSGYTPETCEVKACQGAADDSKAGATCLSFESTAEGKCQSSISCNYAESKSSPGWDLYVYIPPTEMINGFEYIPWKNAACSDRNEYGKATDTDDFANAAYCDAAICQGSGNEACASFEINPGVACQGSASCFPGYSKYSLSYTNYVYVPPLTAINGRYYRKYIDQACSNRNELGTKDNPGSVEDVEAEMCQGKSDTCASFEYTSDGDWASASTTCSPDAGTTKMSVGYNLYVYIGEVV